MSRDNFVYIFDICGTLYKSNTTFDFLNWLFDNDKKFLAFKKIYTTPIWKLFNKFLRVFFSIDLTRVLALRFLKGYDKNLLLEKAENFVIAFLNERKNTEVLDALKKLKADGAEVFIMSATIDVVALAIAKSLGVKNYKSSVLEYDKSICAGKLARDLLGRKDSYLENSMTIAAVYTDDISDVNILEFAKEKNIILYKKTEKKWKRIIRKKKWKVNLIKY